MQSQETITTKQLRDNLSEILERVAIGKQRFIVSKFGKRKAQLIPITSFSDSIKEKKRFSLKEHPARGLWKDKKDLKDSTLWVSKLRKKQSLRIRTNE